MTTVNLTETGTGGADVLAAHGPYAFRNDPLDINLTVDALGGNDTLYATSGPKNWYNFAIGPNANATLTVVNDLFGGLGDDMLYSSRLLGNLSIGQQANYSVTDRLYGGAGDDTYVISNLNTSVHENGGGGTDSLVLRIDSSGMQTAMSLDLNNYTNIENVRAVGNRDFDIFGDGADNDLRGSKGDNLIMGGLGDDSIIGNAGNDTLTGDHGNDTLFGGTGADSITGSQDGQNQISGGAGDDTLIGGDLDDMLHGNGGDDVMVGGDGSDMMYGVDGNDTMSGGLGDDFFVVNHVNDVVIENTGEGSDVVESADISLDGANYTEVEVLQLLDGGVVANLNATAGNQVTLLIGNSDDNVLTATTADTTIFGGDGADTLVGGTGDDTLWGEEGSDTYVLTSGSTAINEDSLGVGIDTVTTSTASLLGGFYSNIEVLELTGSSNLNIFGGNGAADATQFYGNSGDNFIGSYTLDEALYGGAGADALFASDGNDSVYGGADDDDVLGENGDDLVDGGSGDDRILGGWGADTLTGGTGADIFMFVGPADFSGTSGVVADVTSDFNLSDGDKINLHDLGIVDFDGTTGLAGIGNGSVAEDSTLIVIAGSSLYVHSLILDVDGDGIGDYTVDLGTDMNQFVGLNSSDFIF